MFDFWGNVVLFSLFLNVLKYVSLYDYLKDILNDEMLFKIVR